MEFKKQQLLDIIYNTFEIKELTPLITSQIIKFKTELGLSYKEIAQALFYFVNVQKGTPDIKYGLGIVPFVMEEAKAYFKKLKKQKEEQQKSIEEAKKQSNIILQANPQPRRIQKKLIDIESLDIETDNNED